MATKTQSVPFVQTADDTDHPAANGAGPPLPDLMATVATITPAMAARWLETARYDRQRSLSESHVAVLVQAIRAGQYSAQGIVLVESDGQEFLTNGQHRLTAIVQAQMPVREVIIRKRLPSPTAAAAEYSRSDIGRQRNVADQLRAHQPGAEYGLTEREVKTAWVWVRKINEGFEKSADRRVAVQIGIQSPDDRVARVEEWLPEINWYWKLIRDAQPGRTRFLRMQGTGSVALVTRRYCPSQADSFWDRAAHEEHPPFGDPVAALHSVFLRPMTEHAGLVERWARMVASCWNAFYEERPISAPWQTRSEGPMTISGTPYKGRFTESRYLPSRSRKEPSGESSGTP